MLDHAILRVPFDTEKRRRSLDEVPRVTSGVECDHICLQEALQNSYPYVVRQYAPVVRLGPGYVYEERDKGIVPENLAQEKRCHV